MNPKYRIILTEKADSYRAFVETLKVENSTTGEKKPYKSIHIKDGSTGFGYMRIFGPYCNQHVKKLVVEDPYVRSHHQVIVIILSLNNRN